MNSIILIILGAFYTLCFAPYYYIGFAVLSFTGFLVVLDKAKSGRKAFYYGWLFAFFHHVTGIYWVSYSMLIEPDKFAWMIPFSATALPAYLALYVGLAAYITYKFKFKRIDKIIFFAAIWVCAEMARGYVFTGFPWNLTGYALLSQPTLAQGASYIGVYGLSFIAVLVFASPYMLIDYYHKSNLPKFYKSCFSLIYIFPALIIYIFAMNFGGKILDSNPTAYEKTKIRIVQPNIPQKEKFDTLRLGDQLFKYYRLSLQDNPQPDFVPDLIIWPEAATPLNIAIEKEFLNDVAEVIPYSAFLILGSVRQEGWIVNKKFFNSIEFIDSEGNLQRQVYDKFHLVPFGEYVPYRRFLPGVDRIAKGIGDFDRGDGPKTMKLQNSPPFSPLICYEILFSGNVADKKSAQKPEWILNLTNDAWFGTTTGPYQHLDVARMRAIEQGLPVIRSANTGISAVIDSLGRVLQYIKLNDEGIIDANLPKPKADETYFSKNGNETIYKILIGAIILSLFLKCISIILLKARH
jgi:apolipoprotein N-acyltransferase